MSDNKITICNFTKKLQLQIVDWVKFRIARFFFHLWAAHLCYPLFLIKRKTVLHFGVVLILFRAHRQELHPVVRERGRGCWRRTPTQHRRGKREVRKRTWMALLLLLLLLLLLRRHPAKVFWGQNRIPSEPSAHSVGSFQILTASKEEAVTSSSLWRHRYAE